MITIYNIPIFQDSNSIRGQKPGCPLAHQGLQHTAEGFGDHLSLLGLHPESGQPQVGLNWTKDMSVWTKVLMYKSRGAQRCVLPVSFSVDLLMSL